MQRIRTVKRATMTSAMRCSGLSASAVASNSSHHLLAPLSAAVPGARTLRSPARAIAHRPDAHAGRGAFLEEGGEQMTFFHAQAPIAAPTLCATHGCKRSRRRGTYLSTFVVCNAASSALAAGLPGAAKDVLPEDVQVSKAAAAIINYALEFARVSETYEVTSWSLLLGILRFEHSTAAKALQALGLTDLYGAWHEVLWALHSVNALEPRAFVPEIGFADRAYHVLLGACNFAAWGGRTKVQSEDLLLALAAGGVLDGLFPDLKLSFTRVRAAVEKTAGGVYVLPDDKDRPPGSKQEEEDVDFL